MALDEVQQKWLNRLTGKDIVDGGDGDVVERFRAAREKEESDDQALKEDYLDRVTVRLRAEKPKMKKAFQMQLELEGKKIMTRGRGGDQTEALDTEEVSKVTRGPKGQEMVDAYLQMNVLADLKKILTDAQTTRTQLKDKELVKQTVPLFTPQEISDELYDPLVREEVLPENFVPKEFSKTQRMIEGSNDYYLKELEDYTDKSDLGNNLGSVSKLVAIAGKAVKLIPGQSQVTGAVLDLVVAVTTTSLDGAASLVKQQGPEGAQTLVNNVSGIVSTILKTATGNEDLATMVALGMKEFGAAVAIAPMLTEDEPNFAAILQKLGEAVENGFTIAAKDLGKDQEAKQAVLTTIGSGFNTALQMLASGKKAELVQKFKDGKWSEVVKTVADLSAKAAKSAVGGVAKIKSVGKDKNEKKKITDETDGISTAIDEGKKVLDQLTDLGEEFKEKSTKAKKKVKKEEAKKIEEQLKEEQEDYELALNSLGEANPNTAQLKSIAKLVEKMKRDQAIMATASAIGSAGVAVMGKFCAPLAAAGELQKFIANAAAAVQRAMQLRKWVESRNESDSAVSPYTTSIENFVKNQGEQFSYYQIKATLNLIKFAANVSGTAVPFAKVLATGLDLAESAGELVYKFYKERAVKAAWAITKQALENPDNRKLGLIVRRQNPTLAKYSIAYGAIVQKDVIAVSAMNKIGIDRETLSQKDAKVPQLKQYLELLYSDDSKVLGEYTPKGWDQQLPTPALTVKAWVLTYNTAKKNLNFVTANPREVVSLLKQCELDAEVGDDQKTEKFLDTRMQRLQRLVAAFAAFEPKTETGVATEAMSAIVGRFSDLAEVALAKVAEERSLLPETPE